MKREESTLITKKALAASLKKYMTKKTLKKITVSEIITDCNVNRKTFYYHFEDIYALLKWMLEQEAVEVVKQFDLLIDYKDAILFVMDYVETNAHILNCAYDSMGRDEMKRFLCNDFYEIIRRLIDDMEKSLDLNVPEDFKQFVCNLYMEALAGTLIDAFKNRGNNDREKMLKYLSLVLHTSLPETLKQAAAILD
ncbi:TetR/AcrR family transcriptional regulator C-terminal domain-containing protein [Emergencia sp.]|uniref:TetR/AcrR family transcriptional regulator C-terminal domain-containing protein n=1 Tax=Emergencia sp. TaxID=1926557 RepID=UPI003AF095A0